MRKNWTLPVFTWMMYVIATMQFLRVYILGTTFYLKLPAYLSGHERLPFQERVLPMYFMNPFYRSSWVVRHLNHAQGLFTYETGPFALLSLLSLMSCCYFLLKLYQQLSPSRALGVLVYPLFLFTVMMTYSNHLEQNYCYPYDFPAVAFFTAGLYFIFTRRFGPFFFVILIGTLNRETTLFLIGIYVLDAATKEPDATQDEYLMLAPIWRRLSPGQVPWLRVALLSAVWVAIKLTLSHLYAGNDRSEDHLRIGENLERLQPRLAPALLNLCGYLLPVVWVLRSRIRPVRFGNYVYILPVWFAVMFCVGVIVEVRIYGELCSYAALATVLLLEQSIVSIRKTDMIGLSGPVADTVR